MKRTVVILLLLAVVLLPAIAEGQAEVKVDEKQLVLSRELASREPQRIICLAPNMVEVVYALGLGDEIVGWSAYTDYPPEIEQKKGWEPYGYYYNTAVSDFNVEEELSREVAVVSKFYDCNYEIIERLNPTLILGYGTEQAEMIETLSEMGYEGYNHDCYSLDEAYQMMIDVGDILGVGEYARLLVKGYFEEIESIREISSRLAKVPVYFEIAHQTDYGEWGVWGPYTEAAGTPFADMLDIAGGYNVFNDIEGSYIQVEFEDIVSRNPEVILSPYWPNAYDFEVTTLYEIMTRPGFDTIDAVQHGRVYYYDSSLLKRFGPRTVTAIRKLAYLLHPYYFENPENSVSPWELGKIDIFEKAPASLR